MAIAERDIKKRREFLCEQCGVESHVFLADSDDVYSGVQAIRDEHKKWSPECEGDLAKIKLLDLLSQ